MYQATVGFLATFSGGRGGGSGILGHIFGGGRGSGILGHVFRGRPGDSLATFAMHGGRATVEFLAMAWFLTTQIGLWYPDVAQHP